jgi:aryl-alcohol dehydrogenase-like predicted oxidoreductase
MIYRAFGTTGWHVSVIGFGAWGLGGQYGAVEEETALGTVRAAQEAGINFFDTADAYGQPPGRSERLLGRALRGRRDRVYIATKVGNWARRAGHPLPFTHPLHVTLCCDASLHRLGTVGRETTFSDNVRKDFKKWNEAEGRQDFLHKLDLMEKLRFLERSDRTMAQAALQFVISNPDVTCTIPGAKSPAQARANAATGAALLGEEEREQARAVTEGE